MHTSTVLSLPLSMVLFQTHCELYTAGYAKGGPAEVLKCLMSATSSRAIFLCLLL